MNQCFIEIKHESFPAADVLRLWTEQTMGTLRSAEDEILSARQSLTVLLLTSLYTCGKHDKKQGQLYTTYETDKLQIIERTAAR